MNKSNLINDKFCAGDYITANEDVNVASCIFTLRIVYFKGKNGAETTTSIGGGCTIDNLDNYRVATKSEIVNFLEMELNVYKRL